MLSPERVNSSQALNQVKLPHVPKTYLLHELCSDFQLK